MIFHTLLDPSQYKVVLRNLENSIKDALLNKDLRPLSYFHHLKVWTHITEMDGGWFFSFARQLHAGWLLVGVFIFLVLRVLYLVVRRPSSEKIVRFNGLLLLGLTGFVGMAGEIIILILFQSVFGSVYHYVGLIVAAFMIGLLTGGYAITRYLPGQLKSSLITLLIIEALFIGFLVTCALSIPYIVGAIELSPLLRQVIFYMLTILVGVLAGTEFPLVGHILVQSRFMTGYSAAAVDSLDHGGAACGAFATGLILIPAVGIPHSFLVLAILKAGCFVLLSMAALSRR